MKIITAHLMVFAGGGILYLLFEDIYSREQISPLIYNTYMGNPRIPNWNHWRKSLYNKTKGTINT